MKILITGASAFAGFYAAQALRRAGHSVQALLRDGGTNRAEELRRHEVGIVEGNVREPDTYRATLEQCDVVVHTMLDKDDPQGTDRRLFAALKAVTSDPLRHRRLIYTTGCSIYGKVSERVMDETTRGNPAHTLHYRFELEQEALHLQGWSAIVLRSGFIYGNDGATSLSGGWFAQGEQGNVVYRGDPEKGWSWVHVDDLAEAYVRAVEGHTPGEIFCIADEQRPRCIDVLIECARAAGFRGKVELAPIDSNDWENATFDQNEFISSRKAGRLLGWSSRHPGILNEIDTYYASWKATKTDSRDR